MRPLVRKTGLVIEDIGDEILVYDLDRGLAHRLRGVMAFVWRHADGQVLVATIVERLRQGSADEITEDVVWSALESLSTAHLLVEPIAGPSLEFIQSHRAMLRDAAMVDAITIGAITAAAADAAGAGADTIAAEPPND